MSARCMSNSEPGMQLCAEKIAQGCLELARGVGRSCNNPISLPQHILFYKSSVTTDEQARLTCARYSGDACDSLCRK